MSQNHSVLFPAATPHLPRAPAVLVSLSATVRIQPVSPPAHLHRAAPQELKTQAAAFQPAQFLHTLPAVVCPEVYLTVQTIPRLRHQILPHLPHIHLPYHPHHSLQQYPWHQQQQQQPLQPQPQQQQPQHLVMDATVP